MQRQFDLLSTPSGEGQGGLNVLLLEVRVSTQDIVDRMPAGE
jgi:hypothetical protein